MTAKGEDAADFVRGTCGAVHETVGPCSLDEGHRGAHMTKKQVWRWDHHYFGTNEPQVSQSGRTAEVES